MNLKPGYKRTEVGVIPEDWKIMNIDEIACIATGDKNTQDKIDNGIYPFFVRSQTIERINSFSYDGEAVLTAGDGVGTGKVFHYIKGKFDTHQRVYQISDFVSNVHGFFFFQYFKMNFYTRIIQMTAKSSVDSVRREMIAKMKIPLPPTIEEQEKIARALSDTDELLETFEALIEKKNAVKKGAMQELLTGRRRLPGFGKGKGYKKTEVGVIPEDWEIFRLEQIANITMGQSPISSHYNTSKQGLPLVQGNADIKNRKAIKRNYTTHITKVCNEGDILLSVRAPVGEVSRIDFKACIGRGICAITPLNDYLFHHLVLIEPHWAKISTGSTFDAVSSNDILTFVIGIPPLVEEQKAIAKVLSDMDAEIEVLGQRVGKLRQIKKGMMQQLLTGKVRLI